MAYATFGALHQVAIAEPSALAKRAARHADTGCPTAWLYKVQPSTQRDSLVAPYFSTGRKSPQATLVALC